MPNLHVVIMVYPLEIGNTSGRLDAALAACSDEKKERHLECGVKLDDKAAEASGSFI